MRWWGRDRRGGRRGGGGEDGGLLGGGRLGRGGGARGLGGGRGHHLGGGGRRGGRHAARGVPGGPELRAVRHLDGVLVRVGAGRQVVEHEDRDGGQGDGDGEGQAAAVEPHGRVDAGLTGLQLDGDRLREPPVPGDGDVLARTTSTPRRSRGTGLGPALAGGQQGLVVPGPAVRGRAMGRCSQRSTARWCRAPGGPMTGFRSRPTWPCEHSEDVTQDRNTNANNTPCDLANACSSVNPEAGGRWHGPCPMSTVATSSSATPFTAATAAPTSTTQAGWFFLPRWGTGAR